jgi:hypothetical protein
MVPAEQETPEPVWTLWRRGNRFAPAGNRNPDLSIVQPVGKSRYQLSYPGCLQTLWSSFVRNKHRDSSVENILMDIRCVQFFL